MTRWWRDNFSVPIEGGENCLECGRPMQRFRHSAGWRPQARGEPGELPDTSAPMQMILV
jgi:hypothetical protein